MALSYTFDWVLNTYMSCTEMQMKYKKVCLIREASLFLVSFLNKKDSETEMRKLCKSISDHSKNKILLCCSLINMSPTSLKTEKAFTLEEHMYTENRKCRSCSERYCYFFYTTKSSK